MNKIKRWLKSLMYGKFNLPVQGITIIKANDGCTVVGDNQEEIGTAFLMSLRSSSNPATSAEDFVKTIRVLGCTEEALFHITVIMMNKAKEESMAIDTYLAKITSERMIQEVLN